jgi:phosphonate transport system substrate-binding protein
MPHSKTKHMKTMAVSHRKLLICFSVLLMYCCSCFPGTSFSENSLSNNTDADEDVLTFGVYAHVRSTEIHKKFSPIRDYLQKALAERGIHKRVRLKIYTTYPQAIAALAGGEVDFTRYGPVSYILAKRKNRDIRLLAMESNAGTKTFNGVIAVPVTSPVRSLEDLHGRRIAFGDRSSTTGRYLSQAALATAGMTAADFAAVSYLGRHDKVAFAVASGNYDAGALNENTFNKYKQQKGLRAILSFSCVTKPWVARAGLDDTIYAALQQILLEIDDPEVLKPLSRDGLLPADDSDYDIVRDAMRLSRQFDEQQLVFGTYASERPAVVFGNIKPILDELESSLETHDLNVRFNLRVFNTYEEGINKIASGAVDIARLGPASYVMAMDGQPELSVIAQEISFSSKVEGVFIVRSGSPIRSLQDLRGKTLAFASEHSTSGRYLSQAVLASAGITGKTLKSFSYLGRHDKVAFAVAAGNYDAGVLRSTVFARVGLNDRLRAIMRFGVPENLWVARQGLNSCLVAALREAFTSFGHAGDLQGLGLSGFVYPPVDDYEQVREGMALSAKFWSVP